MQSKESETIFGYEEIISEKGEASVIIRKVYGSSPIVLLPEKIGHMTVSAIGAYCFAEKNQALQEGWNYVTKGQSVSRAWLEKERKAGKIRELSGDYIEQVTLPDSVTAIGNLVFYNCRKLRQISFGMALRNIGSDAFMNCKRLKRLVLRDEPFVSTGLKQILAQRNIDTFVIFQVEGRTKGELFFPEYQEGYHEIGPAHIFALDIQGEGFRLRQCFEDGCVDYASYDKSFFQACKEEAVNTLCAMATARILYPIMLSEDAHKQYRAYLMEHGDILLGGLLEKKDFACIKRLGDRGYFKKAHIKQAIMDAQKAGFAKTVAALLQYQEQWFAKEDEYGFDDF